MAQDDDREVPSRPGAARTTTPPAPPQPPRLLEAMSRVAPFGQGAQAEATAGSFDVTGLGEDISLDELSALFGSTPANLIDEG
ncbi:MAG: hypothetical protein AAGI01_07040 [Myxococcota bacterium]